MDVKISFDLSYLVFLGKESFNPIIKDITPPTNHTIDDIRLIPKADKIPNNDNKIMAMGKIKILFNLTSLFLV